MAPTPEAQKMRWLVIWNSQVAKAISNWLGREAEWNKQKDTGRKTVCISWNDLRGLWIAYHLLKYLFFCRFTVFYFEITYIFLRKSTVPTRKRQVKVRFHTHGRATGVSVVWTGCQYGLNVNFGSGSVNCHLVRTLNMTGYGQTSCTGGGRVLMHAIECTGRHWA